MMVSRADSFHEELEPAVANFSGELFENWPSPEENQKESFEEDTSNFCGTATETLNAFLSNEVSPLSETNQKGFFFQLRLPEFCRK